MDSGMVAREIEEFMGAVAERINGWRNYSPSNAGRLEVRGEEALTEACDAVRAAIMEEIQERQKVRHNAMRNTIPSGV